MPASGARRASRPERLPIHAHATPRARSAAATASPGEVWPPVPPPAMTIMSTAVPRIAVALEGQRDQRSEEHTSELQSRLHLVCRLLLEKKKTIETTKGA